MDDIRFLMDSAPVKLQVVPMDGSVDIFVDPFTRQG